MIYGGSLMSNFNGAVESDDVNMAKDILLSEIHKMLEDSPEVLIEALNYSGVETPENISKVDLIHNVVEEVYENAYFRDNISLLISNGNPNNYSNANGEFLAKIKSIFKRNPNRKKASKDPNRKGFFDTIFGNKSDRQSRREARKIKSKDRKSKKPLKENQSLAEMFSGIFSGGASSDLMDIESDKQDDKDSLSLDLQGETQKPNYIPYLVGGSILVVGIATYFMFRNKNK